MIACYLLQQLLIATGLACAATCLPGGMRLAWPTRIFLGVSLTPQAIGLVVMALALADINSPAIYRYAPVVLGLALLVSFGPAAMRHLRHALPRIRLTLPGIMLVVAGGFVSCILGSILHQNAKTLHVFAHDFNVYLAGAKSFSASPGIASIPSFFGGPGDMIVVHPHSFLFEAYLSHALFLQTADPAFPPLDFLPRLAQQLSLVYLLLSIAAVTTALGERRALVAATCLALCVPWVYYIAGTLSRDGFRLAPLYGFMVVLSSLAVNFSARPFRRGIVAGAFAALAIMSHTLNILFLVLSGGSILCFALLRRASNWRPAGKFIVSMVLVSFPAVLRYLENFLETGNFMGYGLQHSIYRGTWIDSVLGERWARPLPNPVELLWVLFVRYGWLLQSITVAVALAVMLICRKKTNKRYFGILIGIWAPLLVSVSNLFNHAGINLSSAFLANARYPLPYFLLSAALLAAGVARLARFLTDRYRVSQARRAWMLACLTLLTAYMAYEALQARAWKSRPAQPAEIARIRFLEHGVKCLADGQQWLADGDRWNVYFYRRPPVFLFTLPARPILEASDDLTVSAALAALNIKLAAFIDSPESWQPSPLHAYIASNWVPITRPGDRGWRALWGAPDIAACMKAGQSFPDVG
jgi:hypothetical protein